VERRFGRFFASSFSSDENPSCYLKVLHTGVEK